MNLDGKRAIVTGAGRGLGRAIARVLAERGARLVLTGRTPSTLESARDEIRSTGGIAEIVPGNVGSRADVDRAVATTVEHYGGVDILVNNAQTLEGPVPLLDITDERVEMFMRSGLLGTLYAMQACHPHLKASGGGSIVNFGSPTALDGTAGFGDYAASKEAIRGLSRVAAKEWGPDGIRVNVICPMALSEITVEYLDQYPGAAEQLAQQVPLRRIGDPTLDIGRAVAALVSDDLAYLTGATLMLDGGKLFIT